MEECKLYGHTKGVLPLPPPTEPFKWRRLPDIQDPVTLVRPFPHVKFPVLPASCALAPDSDLGLVSSCVTPWSCKLPLCLLTDDPIIVQNMCFGNLDS